MPAWSMNTVVYTSNLQWDRDMSLKVFLENPNISTSTVLVTVEVIMLIFKSYAYKIIKLRKYSGYPASNDTMADDSYV